MQFTAEKPGVEIAGNIAIALFRIYQESLTNVARHAEATKVEAQLKLSGDTLVLTVADNGKGFDILKIGHRKTLGLLGMKERSLVIGGKYDITSRPGQGTTVQVSVPLHPATLPAHDSER